MKDVPLPIVAQLIDHSQMTMTLRYTRFWGREIKAAAERFGTTIAERLGHSSVL